MRVLKVSVKWGKEKFAVEADTDEPPILFKSQLFALTAVQPLRQKVVFKGKTLGDDTWGALGELLKDGAQLLLMGSADALPAAPAVQTQFLEDMTDAQAAAAMDIPAGLKNLGNTCYLNATLQCLKTVPELVDGLKQLRGSAVAGATSHDPQARSLAMSAAIRDLYSNMDGTKARHTHEVVPLVMLQVLHMVLPQFSAKDEHGHLMQQDANECWTELVRMLEQQLRTQTASVEGTTTNGLETGGAMATNGPGSLVKQFMGGRFDVQLQNTECDDEPPQTSTEHFVQLSCFLSQEVRYLQLGLKAKLTEDITKRSDVLGRDALYRRTALISRLPAYLSVQMVRFYYKERDQVNAKILKDVKFPLSLDVFDMCTPELQKKLQPMRDSMKKEDDRQMEILKAQKAGEVSTAAGEVVAIDQPFSFPHDVGSNNSGFYELQAVLTHKGRSSNSGHYVGWVRRTGDQWCMCDDDVVVPVSAEDVLKLSGGGDWHCAYVLLYGPRKLRVSASTDHVPVDD